MLKKFTNLLKNVQNLTLTLDTIQQSLGRIETRQLFPVEPDRFSTMHEFKVYSQSGEDGIIQYLLHNVEVPNKRFIEFGVENYLESNTRFLALNNYWSGLIIDGSEENIAYIKSDPIYWRCNIKAEFAFITKNNINDIIKRNGIEGEIGLLSVDIDGNDYWVWEAIENISPAIVIAEYNSFFGPERKVTVPYDQNFIRTNRHYSKIFYGASIAALIELGNSKGYKLVASNQAGNNLFFVRKDLGSKLKELTKKEAFRPINFREVHDQNGKLTYLSFDESRKLIGNLMVWDVELEAEVSINSLWE